VRFNYSDVGLEPYFEWDIEPPADEVAAANALKTLADALVAFRMAGVNVDANEILEAHSVPTIEGVVPPLPDEAPVLVTNRAVPQRYRRAKTGYKRGQWYADALADKAKARAAAELEPDILSVRRVIEESKDFEDVKKRLIAKFKFMDPAPLAALIEKAGIMANFAGKYAVLEDI
jgi:phage gp29-like protein